MHLFACLFVVLFAAPVSVHAATTLSVPFTPQAPEGNWNQPWQDACEETSITMIDAFYAGKDALTVHEAKDKIMRAYRIKTNAFGYSLDEPAAKMVELINRYYPWEARAVERPTIAAMQAELDAGRPMILPAHGTELENPNFRSPLLDYHVIVLTGYDDETEEFISHDPGTSNGLDFRYSYDTIEAAMHDFEPGNMPRAKKVAIFTSPVISEVSAYTDGDGDSLTKAEELLYGTVLWLSDSDGDKFSDGTEAKAGYSPIRQSTNRMEPLLVKPISRPEVYRVLRAEKAHIPDQAAFIQAGYKWSDIRLVRDDIFAYIATIPF